MKNLILALCFLSLFGSYAQSISHLDFQDEQETELVAQNQEGPSFQSLDTLSNKELHKFVKEKGTTAKLIRQANNYFEKMWYAEAARIYDIVLEKGETKVTFDLLSKAGDSHYYSGNLEKAYKWYHKLYQIHKDDIPEDKFFKYTHSLKATGRYKRAERLTKMFQKNRAPSDAISSENNTIRDFSSRIAVKNVSINSQYSDFAPMFHHEGQVVFSSAVDSSFLTTRKYRWNNQPFLDLYTAKTNEEGEDLVQAKKLSKNINTKYHEASVAFSPDQKTIYFTRNNYGKKLRRGKNGVNHLKIYKSNFVDGNWTKAVELPFNSENYSNGHPAISPDGQKMYFVSDRPGGYGGTDIYVVDILENGKFSEPTNLGRTINTSKKEMFPYVTDNAIYFSSDRAMGMGGLDIYKSDHAEGFFSVAVNLGKPINSNRDDFSYIVDEKTQKGYFASNRKGGKGDDDIYSFKQLLNLTAISGVVNDSTTHDLIPGTTVALFDENGEKVSEIVTDENGSFVFENLEPNADYNVVSVKDGYFEEKTQVRTKPNESISVTQTLKRLKEVIAEEKGVLKIETEAIYFDFDKFNIKPQAAEELDKLVEVMRAYPDMVIRIESHTDSWGSKAYNKYLSDKRAKSSRNYIISKGIDASRIESAIGFGEENLLNDCSDGVRCSRELHKLNRRSEFIIISM
ncbi:OmpA family protein [Flagellimonas allohymeniacidonis]|uniref:Cell envelope biogenesis protein OmpA n=1 Tax=Flagellimonas allohymeniacidonis TaxID=2517819 RepID=A0A4Q8QB34_9FLAO|nr:OmpA family protein [Allomuricauda hymeniacidonis]TAI47552.1 cell envelope biogenesis protein OmpA [Allomuricauda hymeniacidonis]